MRSIKILALSISLALSVVACGIHHNRNSSKPSSSTYKVWDDPNDKIYYEGNIVVQTFNSDGEPLYGTKIELFSGEKLLSQMELKTNTGVFNENVKRIIVRASKEGDKSSKTLEIKLDDKLACFINFNLANQ